MHGVAKMSDHDEPIYGLASGGCKRLVVCKPSTAVTVPDYLRDLAVKDRASPSQARGIIYRAFCRAANRSLPAPSNELLMILCGYDSISGPVGPVNKLERLGMIKVSRYRRARQITICSTGKSTRPASCTAPYYRERPAARSGLSNSG